MTAMIGIDPGISGAIAAITTASDGWNEVQVWDMPTIEVRGKRRIDTIGLRDLLIDIGPASMVVVEDVQGVQGSGATSAFNFGRGCGAIEGILVALQRQVTYVTPQRWTKDLGVGADKGAHRLAAQRLWPYNADLFTRAKDDGRADAALLAHWWMRGNQ